MEMLMMSSRELKRVPLDFDCPVGATWQPLIDRPKHHSLPPCPDCSKPAADMGHSYYGGHGDGLSPGARAIQEMWYASFIASPMREHVTLRGHIGQKELDLLIKDEHFTTVIDCPEGCKRVGQREKPEEVTPNWWKTDCKECGGSGWTRKVLEPTLEEVNEATAAGGMFNDLAVGNYALLNVRCELLGIEKYCPTCEGHGDIATAELRKEIDEWEPPSLPEGPGYMLWQTISEGGPVSPVFETLDELAEWLADHSSIAGATFTKAEWIKVCGGDTAVNIHTQELA